MLYQPEERTFRDDLSFKSTGFVSIFFVIFFFIFDIGVQMMILEAKSDLNAFSFFGLEMIGTTVIYVIPPLFISCFTRNIEKCRNYLKFVFIMNIIGIVMSIMGGILSLSISISHGNNYLICVSSVLVVFGVVALLIRLLWTYLSMMKPFNHYIKSSENDIQMSMYHSNEVEKQFNNSQSYQNTEASAIVNDNTSEYYQYSEATEEDSLI